MVAEAASDLNRVCFNINLVCKDFRWYTIVILDAS